MKTKVIVSMLFILSGCSLLFNKPHPKRKNISYYNQNFQLDTSFGLKVDGVYYRKSDLGDFNYLRFYDNGEVIYIVTSTDLNSSDIIHSRAEVYGNYYIEHDTIHYALDAFYFKKEKKGLAYIKDSVLYVRLDSDKYFKEFVFFK